MEFNFSIAPYLKNEITKVGPQLIPEHFRGDRREMQDCVNRINTILTVLGESSAKAQGLQKVITSGERLRNSDHTVFIYADPLGGIKGNGIVIGMLKIGTKRLYLFDSSGENHEVNANCVLDFYVHESRQRSGLGKKLFEFMLQIQNITPQHLAIDKPSDKFSAFLRKHYGLVKTIPQMNNFVLFEGFFDNRQDNVSAVSKSVMAAGISSSAFRNLSGGLGTYAESENARNTSSSKTPTTPTGSLNMFGRPPMIKPISTMGQILRQEAALDRLQNQPSALEINQPNDSDQPKDLLDTSTMVDVVEEIAAEVEVIENEAIVPEIIENEDAPDEADPAEAETVQQETQQLEQEPLPCKIQAATAPHLDLKFYHSSLW